MFFFRACLGGALWGLIFGGIACDSDSDPAQDAGYLDSDMDAENDADGDASDADEDRGPLPVAPYFEPELLEIDSWMLGLLPSSADPVLPDVEAGTMECPDEGEDHRGIIWHRVTPDENGSLGYVGRTIGYAVACITAEEQTRIIARLDFALGIYVNSVLQPGDLYGSRTSRVPLLLDEGQNVIVVRTYGWRGNTEVQLWTTPDELAFNFNDITYPELVVGQDVEQWFGVPLLNINRSSAMGLRARVLENEHFEETEVVYPAIAPGAVTQIGFQLIPKEPWLVAEETVPVTLHVEAQGHQFAYERDIELTTVAEDIAYRRTFRSPIDHSVQYYGVLPPTSVDPSIYYGLVLTLHGAGVEAIGQARAYSQRDWTYVIAPTNRRPYGFDWEEWGLFNGLATLDNALGQLNIDPYRVYITGHSMGGHGTWHLGVTLPGRFATVGPSAGWSSFYSYTGDTRPTGEFYRARAHSDTNNYIGNLSRRGVYIIHGEADDNVPVSEGRDMFAALSEITDDIVYHEQPGAGHWWDGDEAPGADCVDWIPLFDFMEAHTLDPYELDFEFTSSSPGYSATHSFVTIWSVEDPMEDCSVFSEQVDGSTVSLTTTNVRTLAVSAEPLQSRGIENVQVNGESYSVTDDEEEIVIGSIEGKRPQVHGPYNQVYRRPFCFLWGDDTQAELFAQYAAYMTSYWTIYGNGHACGMPLSSLSADQRAEYNLIYLGVSTAAVGADIPFDWNEDGVSLAGDQYPNSALLFVFPEGEHLSAALVTAAGSERLLYMVIPFSSRGGLPDYLVWSASGGEATGFFDADWNYTP